MKRNKICLVAIIFAGLSGLASCGREEVPAEEWLRPVRFILVSDDSLVRKRNFSVLSKSSRESRLSFKVPGTVTSVPVQIGPRVSAGHRIALLDAAA